MFNIVHGSAPEYLKHSINISKSNRYDTRSGNLSCVMPSVKGFGIKSFSTQLVNCGTLYLPTCNMLLTIICSRGMLKHIYGRNYYLLIRMIIFISDHSQQLNCIPLFFLLLFNDSFECGLIYYYLYILIYIILLEILVYNFTLFI